jgi:thioredoxin-related protein
LEKPVVDGLEQELGDKLSIIRIDIQSQAGRELAGVYDFEYAPTFIFFNSQGHELWRVVGDVDPQKVRDTVNQTGN